MAWTELTLRQLDRPGNRYASDLTDAEWALIAPLMPPRKTIGRPRTTDLRAVFDVIVYVATTGCPWRMLPNDFPAVSTGICQSSFRLHLFQAARSAGPFMEPPPPALLESASAAP